MRRRSVLALVASVSLAGCGGILGGGSGVSASLDASSEDFEDYVSDSFDADAGDEVEVTIEAGGDGADIVLVPEEDEVGGDDLFDGPLHEEYWDLDADEEVTDTVEISEGDSYVFMIQAGSADVEADVE